MRGGDTIYYVICKDGSSLTATQRAYHPDELLKNETLNIGMRGCSGGDRGKGERWRLKGIYRRNLLDGGPCYEH